MLACLHGWAIWRGLGGRDGLTNGSPIWRDDHPLYFHSALVTRHFLPSSWTTAGYDPAFMSGYAKSVVFPASSTLPELVIALFGGRRPDVAYKIYVLVSAAAVPWLVAAASGILRARAGGRFVAVALFLVYVWTDFPINYAAFGMLPYLLAIPLGLVATVAFARYCEGGGFAWWLTSALLMAISVLVHFTSAMVIAPAALLGYAVALSGGPEARARFSRSRHTGVWLIPLFVVGVNAFWWLPGLWLASTKGASDFAFAHPEGVLARLRQIATSEPPIERVLILLGLPGFLAVVARGRTLAAALAGFVAAGFFWGYLAGGFRGLDFLQPGRHTFAFYTGLSLAAGVGIADAWNWLGSRFRSRLDLPAAFGLCLAVWWYFGPILNMTVGGRLSVPFLSSQPSSRLLWIDRRVKTHVRPGERLLYEEGGFGLPGIPDPFRGGRFSGLLADRFGIELIGGPYLHASLTTNFTQFGEGKLFGKADWDRDWFVRYARLYRPAAILCWSPKSRAFCRENPDLIDVKDDDGVVLFGRVKGFEGAAIQGRAEVETGPGRLRLTRVEPGLDGWVVLRYHSVPCLRFSPPVAWEPVFLEQDPVPFIRLRPPPGPVSIELTVPPQSRGTGD